MEDEIFDSIGRLITTLQEVAIDERHTPRLYARFLAGLLTKHRRGGSIVAGRPQPRPAASQPALPSQTQSYGGSRSSSSGGHVSHAGMQAQSGSEQCQDSDALQMKLGLLPNAVETPVSSGLASTAPQPDIALSYGHHATVPDSGGSGIVNLFESNDVTMADVLADSGTLATMHALNEVWWGNMMMPGYVFFSFLSCLKLNSTYTM